MKQLNSSTIVKAPNMALNTLLLIITLSFLLLLPLLFLLRKKKRPVKHFPPNPPKLPTIGNLHQFAQSGSPPHQNLWRFSKKFGPIMLLHLGSILTVVISSAQAAKQLFKDNDLNCCSRPASSVLADTLSTIYTWHWRLTVSTGKRYERYVCLNYSVSKGCNRIGRLGKRKWLIKMIDSISKQSASSSQVDVTEKLFALMGSMTFMIVFGTSFKRSNFEHNKFHRVLHDTSIMVASFSAADYFPAYSIGYLIDKISGKHRQFERVSGEFHRFFQQVIDDHLKPGRTKQEHEDIVDVLLKKVKEQTGLGATVLHTLVMITSRQSSWYFED